MTCDEAWATMRRGRLSQENLGLSIAEAVAVMNHLKGCGACRITVEQMAAEGSPEEKAIREAAGEKLAATIKEKLANDPELNRP